LHFPSTGEKVKLILEYHEVIQMLARQLGQNITQEDIKINTDPFNIEICNLDLEQIIQIKTARKAPLEPLRDSSTQEPEAEKPMTEVDGAKEIANMLGQSEELSHTGGGAGSVPDNPEEVPEDFLPPGASYKAPGEMSQDEIRSRNR
jgi:hypothetical protein